MPKQQIFQRLDNEEQRYYERLARLQYNPDMVNQSIRRWNGYSKNQQDSIIEEANQIYADLAAALEAGTSPQSPEVQAMLQRWHDNLQHFYEPTLDVLRGLGQMYNDHPDFHANFQKLHPDLPQYLYEGIAQYVDDLEYAEIERMLAEDDANSATR